MRNLDTLLVSLALLYSRRVCAKPHCRNIPGDPGFPSEAQWEALNSTVSGRLIKVVPSGEYCRSLPGGSCTDAQWTSSVFLLNIPGAMNQVNWEQDYDSHPPSLCLRNSTTCRQGNVPLYAIKASIAADVQAGITFARFHNLRLSIKSSGHDYLGRSTAKASLLIWTHQLQNINFIDDLYINGTNKGSAVTVGSGVTLNTLYTASKAKGKIYVGGSSATVAAAGGYVQGAGHSALSPMLGLAADNVIEFEVVLADGSLVKANEIENPDLFWAMRGGGAGSWGVVISASFQTFSTFLGTVHVAEIVVNSSAALGDIATVHAKHIFDWDDFRAGQYFYVSSTGTNTSGYLLRTTTYFRDVSTAQAIVLMEPFLDDARRQGASIEGEQAAQASINDLLFMEDDAVGLNGVLGSRIIPASVYRESPEAVGSAYTKILNGGISNILGHLLLGGKVADNVNISSAIHPAWRTGKSHVVIYNTWPDATSPASVLAIKYHFTAHQVPLLQRLAGGARSGAYSNEADVREPDFQWTFFGPNYGRLSEIKRKYDPDDLFIVGAGVGSERWDQSGLCRVLVECHDVQFG